MKRTLKDYWAKTKSLRSSLPNLIRPQNVFKEAENDDATLKVDTDKSYTQTLNENLLRYKEIKMVYNKTGIPPAYFVYGLVTCLFFIFIGYFENYLTHLIATLYPMYISIKTLQNEAASKEDITQWLTYWVVYSFFINIECIIGPLLQYIPFYFFIKVIFLLILFLPQYNGAALIYEKILKNVFNKYESHIYDFSIKVVKTISVTNVPQAKVESQ